MKHFIFFCAINLFTLQSALHSQPYSQTIRGRVIDKATQQPMPGANVIVLDTEPVKGAVTDTDGWFKLDDVALGRISLDISFMGYQNVTIRNLFLISGKEMILTVELEESVQHVGEVVVKASHQKNRPNNDMALISARSFTIEETEKYAGSRGDVARMASAYAGVSFANDSRNDIVIRGNSPVGLLWRLEDMDLPNPNHFAENGTTGGPVSMLNNNVLRNSDFITGAFPAEYGNALSGVFDLKMRNGNNEQFEHIFQVGFNGLELGSEGPLSKKHKSSYLANYRFSVMDVVSLLGVDFGTTGVPHYQDLSFKLSFPVKKGLVTWFGIGGISSVSMLDSKAKDDALYTNEGQDLYNGSKMGASGISWLRYLSANTYAKFILSGFCQNGWTEIDTLDVDKNKTRYFDHKISEYRLTFSAFTGTKFNAALSSKAGFTVDQMGYDMKTYQYDHDSLRMIKRLQEKKNLGDGGYLLRTYFELNCKLSDKLILTPGIHLLYYTLTGKPSIEPRMGMSWKYGKHRSINLGYGTHAKTHTLSTYYLGSYLPDGQYVETNTGIGYTKSQQVVLGHDWNLNENLRLKTEAYYQYLYDIPVEQNPTYFSLLNTGAGWGVGAEDSLVNEGTGRNYGIEVTFEKFLSRGYYFLITTSLFDSKYRGSDGIERNTAFNGNYVFNALAGKEFTIKEKSMLTVDLKVTWAGGVRYIPVDIDRSLAEQATVLDLSNPYEDQYPDYFKADIKFGYKMNGKKSTQEFLFFIENVTNHKNVLYRLYKKSRDEVININQLGFYPMMQYRISF
ncbi:MAG: TonB-dependent receptor [Bacteroidales bacterium]|nr:TonB-dependent receptor [Bacteroidales bacterium]